MTAARTGTRTETDSLGAVEVPADRYWGAQTERSRRNFVIGGQRMPLEVVHALELVKKAAAIVNAELELLPESKRDGIVRAHLFLIPNSSCSMSLAVETTWDEAW